MTATEREKLLEQFRVVEVHLSPENLCGDGEASPTWVRKEGKRLRCERNRIIAQLGYTPTYQELYPQYYRGHLLTEA